MKQTGDGKRFNLGKTRYELIPENALRIVADVFEHGCKKYGKDNWKHGMSWSTVFGSLYRHLEAIRRGEDFDKESGYLHVAHVIANAMMLGEYYFIWPSGDDRFRRDLRIGIDIDEVICDFIGGWKERFDLVYDSVDGWFFDRKLAERFKTLSELGELEKFYLSLRPLLDPKDLPFEPACYVTSRPVESNITEQWLDKHGFPSVPVYTVPLGKNKRDVIKELDIDIFIDDRYETFLDLMTNGIMCYLYDAPHNSKYDVGHCRIYNLSDVVTGDHLIKK